MLDTKDPDEIIHTVLLLQPAFGGVNLEDISQPKCFRILDTLREKAEIPIWHDDQQGTACVTLAGLLNALKIVGKPIGEVKIVFIGSGAANVAITRLCFKAGVDPAKTLMVDSQGILQPRPPGHLHAPRRVRRQVAAVPDHQRRGPQGRHRRSAGRRGCRASRSASRGRARSSRSGCAQMADDAIVFACANPVPEIWPWEADGRRRAHRRHRPLRLPEPGEQLAGLPRHLPRRAGRAGAHHHR